MATPTPTPAPAPATTPTPAPRKTWARPCALLLSDGAIFGDKSLNHDSPIQMRLFAFRIRDVNPWVGFKITFSLGESNEDDGFGMSYALNTQSNTIMPTDSFTMEVKFPRGQYTSTIDTMEDAKSLFPDSKGDVSVLSIQLKDDAEVDVVGFGVPFANRGQRCEEWLRKPATAPVVGKMTLLDILSQRNFVFAVSVQRVHMVKELDPANLPEPFSYPYGTDHSWNLSRSMHELHAVKGEEFSPAWNYDDNNACLTAMTRCEVQDVMWLYQASIDIAADHFPAYLVPGPQVLGKSATYYAIVSRTKVFVDRHATAWRRLSKDTPLQLVIYDSEGDEPTGDKWDAKIMDHPESLSALSQHPLDETNLVLRLTLPPTAEPKTFEDRGKANVAFKRSPSLWYSAGIQFDVQLSDLKRKVEAVNRFQPNADVSNGAMLRLKPSEPVPRKVKVRMSVQRDLFRGQGFWHTMRHGVPTDDIAEQLGAVALDNRLEFESLPLVNLLQSTNNDLINIIVEEALEEDRVRFREYLTKRPLGLGIITAGPGFGKTTAIAAATLGMAVSQGSIFASAPTHVAVTNFADRLHAVDCRIVDKYNKTRQPHRHHLRKLIVRAFKLDHEYRAFVDLLRDPHKGDQAAPYVGPGVQSKWTLHLSVAFWLLLCLGSPAVRQPHALDSPKISSVQAEIKGESYTRLREVASGKVTWEEYSAGRVVGEDDIKPLMKMIIQEADILCATPGNAENETGIRWWKNKARAFAVDEAANMHRADLCSLWPNTFPPLLLAGDHKQLAPVVISAGQKDGNENAVNRFGRDGKISPLEFFVANGWPVYRLKRQLRMGNGQFGLSHSQIYSDLPLLYGPRCDVSQPQHTIGRNLEAYAQKKFPGLTPSPAGTLTPLFVHCEGAICHVDPSGSKRNPGQVEIALDFLQDFMETTGAKPDQILILTPYRAMVEAINDMRKKPKYSALHNIRPASTVDSIQGQEGDMTVCILAATHHKGPGFIADERRLNVMLTRHRSACVIFGDKDVAKDLGKDGGKGKAKAKGKGKGGKKAEVIRVITAEGLIAYTNPAVLRGILEALAKDGRMVTVVKKEKAQEAK